MITFILNVPNHPYKLELRWNERLSAESLDVIVNTIDALHGVERVNTHRYALEIFYAAHLVDDKSLGTEIRKALQGVIDPTVAEVL